MACQISTTNILLLPTGSHMVWSFINWYPDAQLQERHWLAGSSLQKCSHPPLLAVQLVYLTSVEKMNSKRDMRSWKAKESQEGKVAKRHCHSSEQQLTMDLGWQLWALMALEPWDTKQTLVQNKTVGRWRKTEITVRAGRLENRKFSHWVQVRQCTVLMIHDIHAHP